MLGLRHLLRLCTAVSAILILTGSAIAERTWTDVNGRTMKASLVSASADAVDLRLRSGRISTVPFSLLSKPDVAFVKAWKSKRIAWLDEVDVSDSIDLEVVAEDAPKRNFVYRTKHFEFHSDRKIARSLINDFSLAFEATFAGLNALPLNLELNPPAEGHFQIWLFGDRRDYWREGGPVSTAGVYIPIERRILIPMELLNLKLVGSELRKRSNSSYDNSTLIHEITHQVMHDWLNHLPIWMVEGLAEYMSSVPYANGKFRFAENARNNGLKAALKRWEGGARQASYFIRPARELFKITSKQWNHAEGNEAVSNYSSSMLFVFYFMHLEGSGRGAKMVEFISDIRASKKEATKYIVEYEAALRQLLASLENAENTGKRDGLLEQGLPRILENSPDTHIYREGSTHRKALEKLIGEGTLDVLHEQVVAAFKANGIRLR
jgi:hypothetical protein